ncbi:MFS transporter [Sphingomonas crocodyli]|uniref:MFS transporter n=1 Tax=Sphingomonas crocodyli TaxID=1979270 RepID=A0A437M7Q3_9SPHN|nr:MFS transporter [Sphingomonas crocodyli]RVT93586.1 MFS transporter [Sphingomonas crocodyli]
MDERSDLDRSYRKIGLRLIPFLFVCYLFNYIDRVNVGFAKLRMLDDLGMSEVVYGLAAGIFFIGYLAFGVPSNLILQRVGARRWIAVMMVVWGVFSVGLMFVRTPIEFYVLRFLTGAAEAGFFPGIVFYLTRWFPPERHGRVMTVFMSAIPMSGVLGGPVSGWILAHFREGQGGLLDWQWLYLLQGAPTVLLGVLVWFVLSDGIETAPWLTPDERTALTDALRRGDEAQGEAPVSLRIALLEGGLWTLGLIYFCIQSGVYAINFWLPTIISASGETEPLMIGLMSAVPYAAAVVFMLLLGRSGDRRNERRWHLIVPMAVGAIGLLLAGGAPNAVGLSLFGMTLAAAGALSALPMFWPIANRYLSASTAAGGLALINSIGQIAGFLSPYMVGWIKQASGTTSLALFVLAAALLIGIALVLRATARPGMR